MENNQELEKELEETVETEEVLEETAEETEDADGEEGGEEKPKVSFFNPDTEIVTGNEPYTVEYNAKDNEYVVEGPRIEKMLGYTNLESEKGFKFFQHFLKDNGILDELEALGIQEGDTVRMYGLAFNYYK